MKNVICTLWMKLLNCKIGIKSKKWALYEIYCSVSNWVTRLMYEAQLKRVFKGLIKRNNVIMFMAVGHQKSNVYFWYSLSFEYFEIASYITIVWKHRNDFAGCAIVAGARKMPCCDRQVLSEKFFLRTQIFII